MIASIILTMKRGMTDRAWFDPHVVDRSQDDSMKRL